MRPLFEKWRDDRMRRAVREVLRKYSIEPSAPGKATFAVCRGSRSYEVAIDPRWTDAPSCTCPDARRVDLLTEPLYCKHSIAVLLKFERHRHQLLDLFL